MFNDSAFTELVTYSSNSGRSGRVLYVPICRHYKQFGARYFPTKVVYMFCSNDFCAQAFAFALLYSLGSAAKTSRRRNRLVFAFLPPPIDEYIESRGRFFSRWKYHTRGTRQELVFCGWWMSNEEAKTPHSFSHHELILLVDGIPLVFERVQELGALHLSQLFQVVIAIADLRR